LEADVVFEDYKATRSHDDDVLATQEGFFQAECEEF